MKQINFFKFYKYILYLLPEEISHNFSTWILKHNLLPKRKNRISPYLETIVAGIKFKNPVGLAAGFDKNANCIKNLSTQGFGFIEVGTVTPKPQAGNTKPRLFRLTKKQAIINRMGFNNVGKISFLRNFNKSSKNIKTPIGINIGKNKLTKSETDDYLELLDFFYQYPDYITINISSPNTPNLRDIQDNLDNFISKIKNKVQYLEKKHFTKKPIFLKISPDIDSLLLKKICNICLENKIDALIISNTTISRFNIKTEHIEGGLSGKPLKTLANKVTKEAYQTLKGRIPIIGVGGISSGQDAYERIKSGANLIQIYSSIIFNGLSIVSKINNELEQLLQKDGYKNISEICGIESTQ